MSDLERGLLAHMTTTEGMAQVTEAEVGPQVFEDPVYRTAFEWMTDYRREYGTHPTMRAFEQDFPSVQIPHQSAIGEPVAWLIQRLQERHVLNNAQELMLSAGRTLHEDPVGTLRRLIEEGRDIVERVGSDGKLDSEFLTADQLDELEPPEPLITDVLSRHTYGVLRGRDASFKSFVALDWALCLASGTPWQGKAVDRVKVLYVAAEGAHGIAQRVRAWEAAHDIKLDPDWFVIRKSAVNVFRAGEDYAHLLDHVERGGYGLVVVDTLRRVSGGANGNDTDMGVVVDNLDRIKRATNDGTVLVVAHTDKGDNDTRGFSGIEDDADIVWSAKREANTDEVTIVCEKFKDGPDGHRFDLRARTHGDSLVMVEATARNGADVFTESNETDQRVMATMRELFSVDGATVHDLVTVTGLSQASVYRSRARLQGRGRLRSDGTRRLFLCGSEEFSDAQTAQ